MFRSPSLRLLTAVLLATWSPGRWCCCQAHAGGGALEVVETSCCSAEPVAAPAAKGCCTDGGRDLPADERPCGCVHGPNDVAVTTPAIAAVGGAAAPPTIDVLVELPPLIAAVGIADATSCRGSPGGWAGPWAPPGDRSLLALHCQLTT